MTKADEIRDLMSEEAEKATKVERKTRAQNEAAQRALSAEVKSEIPDIFKADWFPKIQSAAKNQQTQVCIKIGPVEKRYLTAEKNELILKHGVEYLKAQGFLAEAVREKERYADDDPGTIEGSIYIGWGKKLEFPLNR